MCIETLSAVTLLTCDQARSIRFYQSLGFEMESGGPDAPLSSFRAGAARLNLLPTTKAMPSPAWGRLVFHVTDVDALYARALAQGYAPLAPPRDAEWGETLLPSSAILTDMN